MGQMKSGIALAGLLAAGAVLACQDTGGRSLMGIVADSAGVEVFTVPPPPDRPDWDLSAAAVLQIAGQESDPIGRARAVLWWDSARIVLADDDMSLRIYSLEGHRLMVLGGRGQGPGEFMDLWEVARLASGELAVWDPHLNRMTLFTDDGRLARSHTVREAPAPYGPLFLVHGLTAGDRLVATTWSPIRSSSPRNPGAAWGLAQLLIYSALEDAWEALGALVVHRCRDAPRDSCRAVPGQYSAPVTLSPGGVWVAPNDWPEVMLIDLEGSLQTIIREEALGLGGFTRLLVGSDGSLWVSRVGDRDWLVFDRASVLWRRVRFPGEFRLFDVWGGRAVGLTLDSLGIQRIVVLDFPEGIS